ncbi:MAG: RdgB/HAM1 family non-canonical purine NTP pyrophosphatase [Mycobacteriales bacterium]
MPRTVLLATHNRKKLIELERIVASVAELELVTLDDVDRYPAVAYPEPVETGATFAENALIKAREGARVTGLITIADDSGLCVDALYGAPGVFSARWAGRHGDDDANLELLLAQLTDVPDERRTAAFVCAAALVIPVGTTSAGPADGTPAEQVEHGRLSGDLLRARRGDGGFGYDPIFVPTGQKQTTAELSASDKDRISHRGQAFRALAPALAALPGVYRRVSR